jgi:hypothetical protein
VEESSIGILRFWNVQERSLSHCETQQLNRGLRGLNKFGGREAEYLYRQVESLVIEWSFHYRLQ